MATSLTQLSDYTDRLLEIEKFEDYCPNGLQIEGKDQIEVVVSGVTASMALIEAALDLKADALLVHHGYFWRGENPALVGMKGRRIRQFMKADLSLLGYHLPLDAHPELGNNAQLGALLGIEIIGEMYPHSISDVGNIGNVEPQTASEFAQHVSERLGRGAMLVEAGEQAVRSIAWCTGGAQGYIDRAADLGADLYLTGEVSEQTVHVARERGLHFIAAGHHATERYGAKALGEHLAEHFGLVHHFVDIDNPA